MTYQEALRIGNKAQGTLRCTYAELYDKNGKKLFSIQKVQPREYIERLYDENGKFLGNDKYTQHFVELTDDGMKYTLSLALVEVEKSELTTNKLVPCYLLYDTYVYLRAAILASRKHKFVEEVEENGEKKTIETVVYGDKYNYLYQKMQAQVTSGEPFYVKPLAFDWHPTDINTEEVEEQRKEVKKTTLLALAAGALVLCGK